MAEWGILELLNAGGNTAMMALVAIMWRFDRRLLKLEITLHGVRHEKRG